MIKNTLRQVADSISTAILIMVMSNAAKDFSKKSSAVNEHTPLLAANHGTNTAFILTIALCLLAEVLSLALASKKKRKTN